MAAQLQEFYEVLGCPRRPQLQMSQTLSMQDALEGLAFLEPIPLPFDPRDITSQPITSFWKPEYTVISNLNAPARLTEQSILGAIGLDTIIGAATSDSNPSRIPIHLPVKRLLQDPTVTSIRAYPPPRHATNRSDVLITANLPTIDSSKASLLKMRRAHGFSSVPSQQLLEENSYWVQNLQKNISTIIQTNSYSSADNSEQHTPAFDSPHPIHSSDSSDADPDQLTEALKYPTFMPHVLPNDNMNEGQKRSVGFSALLRRMHAQNNPHPPRVSRSRSFSIANKTTFNSLLTQIRNLPTVPPHKPTVVTQYVNVDRIVVRTANIQFEGGVINTGADLTPEQVQTLVVQLSPQNGKDAMECEIFGLPPINPYDPAPFLPSDQLLFFGNSKRPEGSSAVCLSSLTLESASDLHLISGVTFAFNSLRVALSINEKLARKFPVSPAFIGANASAFATDSSVFPIINILINASEYKRLLSKAKLSQFTRLVVRRVFQRLSSISSQLLTSSDMAKFVSSFASVEAKCELSGKSLLSEVQNVSRMNFSSTDFQTGNSVVTGSRLPVIPNLVDVASTTKSISSPAVQMLTLHTASANYSLNIDIPQLAGFLHTATADQTAESFRVHPTLCHFLVALLAHQHNDSYISLPYSHASNDPLFYTNSMGVMKDFNEAIGESPEIQGRKSALLPHILIAIRDTYTLVPGLLIPEYVPVSEAVITALNYMTSPSSALIDELLPLCIPSNNGKQLRFTSTESTFDFAGRTPLVDTGPLFQGYFESLEPSLAFESRRFAAKDQQVLNLSCGAEPPLKHHAISSIPPVELLNSVVRANTLLQAVVGIPLTNLTISTSLQLFHTVLANSVTKNTVCTADFFRKYKDLMENGLSEEVPSDTLLMMTPNKAELNLVRRNYLDNLSQYTITPIKLQAIQYTVSDYFSFISDSAVYSRKMEGSLPANLSATDSKGKGGADKALSDVKSSLSISGLAKGAILAITSPILGEYRLMTEKPTPECATSLNATYYGVDISLINALGYAVSYLLSISSQEYKLLPRISLNDLMTPQSSYHYVQMRINSVSRVRQDKHTTLSFVKEASFQYTSEETLAYRAQEKMRFYLLPNYQYIYVIRGHRVPVVPIQRSITQRLPEIPLNTMLLPRIVSKVFVVRDALARLAGRFGTISDIADTCCDSGFYFYQEDQKLTSGISTILEKLHQVVYSKENDQKICSYLTNMKLWTYTHAKAELFYDLSLRKDNRFHEPYPYGLDTIYQRGK